MLTRGADPNELDVKGRSPLNTSRGGGMIALVAAGADVSPAARLKNDTPTAHLAVCGGSPHLLDLIILAGGAMT